MFSFYFGVPCKLLNKLLKFQIYLFIYFWLIQSPKSEGHSSIKLNIKHCI